MPMNSVKDAYSQMFTEYPDIVSIDELCAMLGGISTKTAYKLLRDGKIHSVRVGRAYKIPKASIIAYFIDGETQ